MSDWVEKHGVMVDMSWYDNNAILLEIDKFTSEICLAKHHSEPMNSFFCSGILKLMSKQFDLFG